MRRRGALIVAGVLVVLAGCGPAGPTPTALVGGDGTGIVAENLAFDRAELEVPARTTTQLVFENHDGMPHNVAVYADDAATESVFVGEIFSGPGSRVYVLPPLAAGAYLFRCDVHPDMRGRLVARTPVGKT